MISAHDEMYFTISVRVVDDEDSRYLPSSTQMAFSVSSVSDDTVNIDGERNALSSVISSGDDERYLTISLRMFDGSASRQLTSSMQMACLMSFVSSGGEAR